MFRNKVENERNNSRKMHDSIKELIGNKHNKRSPGGIEDKKGKMLFEKKEVLGRWAEYVGELFEDQRPPLPQPSNNNGPSILKSEVELAMKNSSEGKAPGEDGINTEMLKHLD